MLHDALACWHSVAGNDVDDSGGEADLVHQLGDAKGAHRCEIRRLHHNRVACRQRRAHLPAAEHERKVPRHDLADDAERLRRHVVQESCIHRNNGPLELVGHATEVAEGCSGAGHVEVARVADRVAGVAGFQHRQVVDVRFNRIGELEEESTAIHGRHPTPAVLRGCRSRYGAINIGRLRFSHLRQQGTIMRIEDINRGAVERVNELTVDEQACLHGVPWVGECRGTCANGLELDRIGRGLAAGDHLGQSCGVVLPDQKHRPLGRIALMTNVGRHRTDVAGFHGDA